MPVTGCIRLAHFAALVTCLTLADLGSQALLGDTLSPHIIGGVKDSFPTDGAGDAIDDGPFIARVPGGEYRAIVEYDVSALPRGTVLSASLTGTVGPNNSLDVGMREHLLEVYTGNGVVDLADFGVPGIEAGRFSHASGDSTDYDFDITGILHNLLTAGADYIGMRISPVSTNMPFDVLHGSFPAPTLSFEILPANAHSVQLLPVADARAVKEGGDFEFRDGEDSISIQRIDFIDYDRRGILEYDLSSVPANADITDAKVVFDVWTFTHGGGEYPECPIYGYAGNGVAELADGFQTSQQIGLVGPVMDLGAYTADLDHDLIETLRKSSDFFGMTIVGGANGDSVGFSSLESSRPPFFDEPAKLLLTYTVPPSPGDFNEDGSTTGDDLADWKAAFGVGAGGDADADGDTDGADFLIWQRSIAAASISGEAAAQNLPEPSAACLAMLALLARYRLPRRR